MAIPQVKQDIQKINTKISQISPFNVMSYGAKGDGINDDTLAIQTCFNATSNNSSIFFPDGTYIITGIILTQKQNIHIYGHGAILKLKDNANSTILTLDNSIYARSYEMCSIN